MKYLICKSFNCIVLVLAFLLTPLAYTKQDTDININKVKKESTVRIKYITLEADDDTDTEIILDHKPTKKNFPLNYLYLTNEDIYKNITEDISDEIIKEEMIVPYYFSIKVPNSDFQNQGGLLDIENPDEDYIGGIVLLTDEDRDLLEKLIYGEAGNQGFIGICLVAQCLRDAMLYEDFESIAEIRKEFRYYGSIKKGTSDEVKRAIEFIFNEGHYAVKHPILYFYIPIEGKKGFHETQEFIVQYKKTKFYWKAE